MLSINPTDDTDSCDPEPGAFNTLSALGCIQDACKSYVSTCGAIVLELFSTASLRVVGETSPGNHRNVPSHSYDNGFFFLDCSLFLTPCSITLFFLTMFISITRSGYETASSSSVTLLARSSRAVERLNSNLEFGSKRSGRNGKQPSWNGESDNNIGRTLAE